jgi:GNAT superfamily N-acetyltransferase
MPSLSLRPLHQGDVETALALLRDAVSAPAYVESLASVVRAAALTPDVEQRGILAEVDGAPAALVVYGEFAGATGAGRLHLVVVDPRHRRRGLGTLLLERAGEELTTRSVRFILVELPDDRPTIDDYFALLRASGFNEESRVPDFYREGVGLVFMRREVR